jgi:hypothetical protein
VQRGRNLVNITHLAAKKVCKSMRPSSCAQEDKHSVLFLFLAFASQSADDTGFGNAINKLKTWLQAQTSTSLQRRTCL